MAFGFKARRKWFQLDIDKKRFFKIFLIVLSSISGALSTFFTFQYLIRRQGIISEAKNKSIKETKRAAQEINDFMEALKPLVTSIADQLNTGALSFDNIERRLLKKPIDVAGVGVAFVPGAYDASRRLYAPYYTERDGEIELVNIEKFYDYSGYPWFTTPIKQGSGFLDPFFDEASNEIVAAYAAPFTDRNLRPLGVVFASQSTSHIQNVIRTLELGRSGYGEVVTKDGVFVAHPNPQYVKQGRTIFDLAKEMNNVELEKVAEKAIKGERGFIDHENTLTGQQSWLFFEPIPSTGWSMIGVFAKGEIALNTAQLKQNRIHIMLSFIFLIIFLSLFLLKAYTGKTTSLVLGSLVAAGAFLLGIIFMWHIALTRIDIQTAEEEGMIPIYDQTNLTRYLETIKRTQEEALGKEKKDEPIQYIATPVQEEDEDYYDDIELDPDLGQEMIADTVIDRSIDAQGSVVDTAVQASGASVLANGRTLKKASRSLQSATKDLRTANKNLQRMLGEEDHTLHIPNNQQLYPGAPQELSLYNDYYDEDEEGEERLTAVPATVAIQQENLIQIPTGLYIHSLALEGIDKISIIGNIWQRYAKGAHENIQRGVNFPQAERMDLQEAYKFTSGNWEIIGWNMKGLLKQNFDYKDYPFDTKKIYIQIWPNDFEKGVILKPDLPAYLALNPSSLPGINKNLILQDWEIQKSSFSYKTTKYFTNFGFYIAGPFGTVENSTKSLLPEMYFNITLNRYILSSLILRIAPILVIMIILFIVLIMLRKEVLVFRYILGTITSLFFAAILAHVQFKGSIPVQHIVFFEYFYFVLYSLILLIALISILHTLKTKYRIIQYENMLIPVLLYWPMLTGFMLWISLVYFY